MCGICGKLEYDPTAEIPPELLQRMMDVISHRGPDGEGKYLSGPVGLGHRRLAIIDLNTGAQPMTNEDGTVWIVFNGEIYNFPELRRELLAKGHHFSSTTDTEVIIHLYEEYGVDCLSRLRGMFAFAIWDKKDQTLFLARDRVGIKPLYYADTGSALLFGSEIKSLLVDPGLRREVDPQMVDRFLTFLYPAGRETLFKGILKLDPGNYLLVKNGRVVCRKYWDLQFKRNESLTNFNDAADMLHGLVSKTVKDHMISDVPVGILLSGGVDSTAILGCAVQETQKKIKTFTVGFEDRNLPTNGLSRVSQRNDSARIITKSPFRPTSSPPFCRRMYGTWRSRCARRRPSRCIMFPSWRANTSRCCSPVRVATRLLVDTITTAICCCWRKPNHWPGR